jgi:hypothetical protein
LKKKGTATAVVRSKNPVKNANRFMETLLKCDVRDGASESICQLDMLKQGGNSLLLPHYFTQTGDVSLYYLSHTLGA